MEMTEVQSLKIRCFDAETQCTGMLDKINRLTNLLTEIAGKVGVLSHNEQNQPNFEISELNARIDEMVAKEAEANVRVELMEEAPLPERSPYSVDDIGEVAPRVEEFEEVAPQTRRRRGRAHD
ncbi:coil containing protein [Vibrio phage 3.058.O._10N.286.46.B8]|nr:coil containing protein [Vibrio phage 2.058.O._10N.286.46.B8]AUS03109.1 coil containing protein [Vibrio phage 3.058.O._10N.286.46.B8]